MPACGPGPSNMKKHIEAGQLLRKLILLDHERTFPITGVAGTTLAGAVWIRARPEYCANVGT